MNVMKHSLLLVKDIYSLNKTAKQSQRGFDHPIPWLTKTCVMNFNDTLCLFVYLDPWPQKRTQFLWSV